MENLRSKKDQNTTFHCVKEAQRALRENIFSARETGVRFAAAPMRLA
jgi:hypothetical protein